jgi:hypothetical protein
VYAAVEPLREFFGCWDWDRCGLWGGGGGKENPAGGNDDLLLLLSLRPLAFPFADGTGEGVVVAVAASARGANAENVCGVGLGVVKVVCAGVVVFIFSFSLPLSFLNFEDDDNGVEEESTSFLPFSVSTATTTSCFIFSFEPAAGPRFALTDVCDFEDFPGVRSRGGSTVVVVVIFTATADPLGVTELGAAAEGTDRLTSLVTSPSAKPCWVLFRLEAAMTGGGDDDGVDRLTSLVTSPSAGPCWLFFRLEGVVVVVDVVVLLTDSVVAVVVVGLGFIVTKPCLVRLVVVPPFPCFLSSNSAEGLTAAAGLVLVLAWWIGDSSTDPYKERTEESGSMELVVDAEDRVCVCRGWCCRFWVDGKGARGDKAGEEEGTRATAAATSAKITVSLESLNLNDLRLGFLPLGNIKRLDAIEVRGEVLGVKKRSSRSESSEGSRSSNSL